MFNIVKRSQQRSGFSLVEILVTASLIALVFGGLFVSIQLLIKVIQSSKAEAGATALAVEKIEYIRSLPYNSVGTAGGPVYGLIDESSTVVLNDVEYTERIVVRYEDDPADGLGYANDAIIEDYKKVLVEYRWDDRGEEKVLALSTNVVPPGIETGAGGGSLRIVVQDRDLDPVANAQVTIINDDLATTTNTVQYTNPEGVLVLSGVPAGAGYMVSATKAGYSTDGTVEPTAANPNPFSRPLTVAEGAVTTKYLTIDQLSDLSFSTQSASESEEFFDDFDDDSQATSTTNVTFGGGVVELTWNGVGYPANGTFFSIPITDAELSGWESLTFSYSTPSGTEAFVRVYYDDGGVPALIPDAILPGNSAGFTFGDNPIDLTGVDPAVYDTLILGAELTTIDSSATSQMKYWVVDYRTGGNPITDVDIVVRGGKLLGNDPNPIYKFETTITSDGYGEVDLNDVEWDAYSVFPQGYRLAEMCPDSVLNLDPNDTINATIGLAPAGIGLQVTVVDTYGNTISDADLRLFNYENLAAYDQTLQTSSCGQAYFSGNGLAAGSTYALDVQADGYAPKTEFPTVSSDSTIRVELNED